MSSLGEGVVEHYADAYDECLELALNHPEEAVRNTHTLQYFALDVYAFDIALPNDGCTGKATGGSASSSASNLSTMTAATTSTTGTVSDAVSTTTTGAAVSRHV